MEALATWHGRRLACELRRHSKGVNGRDMGAELSVGGAELSVGSVNKKNAGVLSTQGPRLLGLSSLKII